MDKFWLDGLGDIAQVHQYGYNPAASKNLRRNAQAHNEAMVHRAALKDLTHQVERLSLLSQALWELLRERAQLSDEDLLAQTLEVDLRDGVQDERITARPLTCPACRRVSSSKHYRCLYCSQRFERPLFG